MGIAAVILAAGRGERAADGGGVPKQFRTIAGHQVLGWATDAFRRHPKVDLICEVTPNPLLGNGVPGMVFAKGGVTRQQSVRLGLEALAKKSPPDRVLIHDGVRPFVSDALIDRVIDALDRADAVAPMLPVADTLRRREGDGFVIVPREPLMRAQTPQGFRFDAIYNAHQRFASEAVTDDFALAERAGLSLATVAGEEANMKLTTQDDFALAERIACGMLGDVRTATGYDAHRFGPGDHAWLCGIRVPYDRGLVGHSDADVGLHALTDAILGALGAGDIGMHFPSLDPQWKNEASQVFLARAANLVRERRGVVANADVTLICESPKIGPHRDAMRSTIASLLGVTIDRVSVKATTTDGMGFTGRGEGIAAQATATIRLPAP